MTKEFPFKVNEEAKLKKRIAELEAQLQQQPTIPDDIAHDARCWRYMQREHSKLTRRLPSDVSVGALVTHVEELVAVNSALTNLELYS